MTASEPITSSLPGPGAPIRTKFRIDGTLVQPNHHPDGFLFCVQVSAQEFEQSFVFFESFATTAAAAADPARRLPD